MAWGALCASVLFALAPLAGQARADAPGDRICARYRQSADHLECLFRLAMTAKRQRRYRRSIALLRRMLAISPNLPRVRLELASAYFRTGNDTQAERHFRYALGGGLPPRVARRVQGYLDAIRARRYWSASFDFSLAPQSNVNQATKARVITAGGIPWTLTRDSRKKAGVRVSAKGDFLARPPLARDVRAHVRFTPSVSATTDGDFNPFKLRVDSLSFASWSLSLNGELGLVFLSDRQEISAGIAAGHTWYEGDSYLWTYGGWLRASRELNDLTQASFEVALNRLDYASRWAEKDGWEPSVTLGLRRQLAPWLALNVSAPFVWHHVRPGDKAYLQGGLTLGFDAILPADFSFYAGAGLSRTRYQKPDRVFAKRRKDWKVNAVARLTWAKWTALDFAPYIEYTYENRRSTLRLHEYENHSVMLGLTKRF